MTRESQPESTARRPRPGQQALGCAASAWLAPLLLPLGLLVTAAGRLFDVLPPRRESWARRGFDFLLMPLLMLVFAIGSVLSAPIYLLLKLLEKIGWLDTSMPDCMTLDGARFDDVEVLHFSVDCDRERQPSAYRLFGEWLEQAELSTLAAKADLWRWQPDQQEFRSTTGRPADVLSRACAELSPTDSWFYQPSLWLLFEPTNPDLEQIRIALQESLHLLGDDGGSSTANLHRSSAGRASLAIYANWDQGQLHLIAELALAPPRARVVGARLQHWLTTSSTAGWQVENHAASTE